ncbi:DUF4097 family beta strand repeat-containing protein [Lentzea nigeriaca]|uniref:DUF4097 family beta strand repeat-containing protein n=1 Tax=Lentzea nigeriaca TaxID=1128665 RepID=UPI00195D115C|nr:DUF4097 family beta strand repeat-containing protein [Lentzea nigeriaca]MBM7861476.1 DUF4097 and DUF4098 domain-containing protein YvlB [Lentzea nigeriaca]
MTRTALVALLVGAVLTACGIRIVKYEFTDDNVVAEKFTSVRVRTGSGIVAIRYVPGLSETKIHRKVEHNKDNRPTGVSHRIEGSSLVLDDCGRDCEVNYDVQVPSADIAVQGDVGSGDVTLEGLTSVDYRTGSGRIVVQNIAGNVQVTSGSGDIDVRDIAGDVKAVTSSGKFEAAKVRGSLTADLGSGNITLDQLSGKTLVNTGSGNITGTAIDNDVTADADSGNVELNFVSARTARVVSGSGNITVRVPVSAGPYKVTAESGSGDRKIDVPTDPAAKHELKLNADSGNVKVLAV